MRIVICGTRHCPFAYRLINSAWDISPWGPSGSVTTDIIILYGASGDVDMEAPAFARARDYSSVAYPANWDAHGRSAGPIRNRAMAQDGDAVLALWDGKSRGTLSMITEATRAGKPVFVYPINGRGE